MRFQATEQIRASQTFEAQLKKLMSVVEVTRSYESYEQIGGEDGELEDCVVQCGAKVQVKFIKRCNPEMCGGLAKCCADRRHCFCRPNMCFACIAKWFKDEEKTTCPTCRVEFCMHDVVPVTLREQ